MKILATGLTGLVGGRIAEVLGDYYQWTNLSRETGVDLTDTNAVRQAITSSDAPIMLHCAAMTDVGKAEQERGDETGATWQINVTATETIAKACQATGKKLILVSTDYVFDGKKGNYVETDETMTGPDQGSWYGWTKAKAEQVVQKQCQQWIIARIAFPFCAKSAAKLDFMRKTYKGLVDHTLYPLFTDQFITPTFIDDIALAIHALIDTDATGIYHVAGSTTTTPYEAARTIAEMFDLDTAQIKEGSLTSFLATQDSPNAALRYPQNSSLKNEKIQALLAQKQKTMHAFNAALAIVKQQGIQV